MKTSDKEYQKKKFSSGGESARENDGQVDGGTTRKDPSDDTGYGDRDMKDSKFNQKRERSTSKEDRTMTSDKHINEKSREKEE